MFPLCSHVFIDRRTRGRERASFLRCKLERRRKEGIAQPLMFNLRGFPEMFLAVVDLLFKNSHSCRSKLIPHCQKSSLLNYQPSTTFPGITYHRTTWT